MREAKRLFSKSRNKQLQTNSSSVFKSKIMRDLPDQSKLNSIGPGQYNISFPIVKPKFQAIRKNNNTIIIKVNQKLSPAFQSLEPRFREARQQHSFSVDAQQQNQGLSLKNSQKNIQTQKISNGMKSRIKKLSQILSFQQNISRKDLLISFKDTNAEGLQSIKGSAQVVNSIKLYKKERQRLHFLLKYMKPGNGPRGYQWSKYRQTKGNLYSINNVPGPGSYDQKNHRETNHRYFQTLEVDKSWQFKSVTRRGYYQNAQQRLYQLSPTRNRFISDINGKFYKVDSIPIIKNKSTDKIQIDNNQY